MRSQSNTPQDIYGQALYEYFQHGKAKTLYLHTSYGQVEEMPVDWFFRDEEDFPELELRALDSCKGKILDVGAGVGSHAVYFHESGKEVHCLDQSPYCVQIMKERGLSHIYHQSIWDPIPEKYDTLLLLMNGIGVVGKLEGLRKFLRVARNILQPLGKILFDSSDLSYLYEDLKVQKYPYKGEIQYQYEYKGVKDAPFSWLYIDQSTLHTIVREEGWKMNILFEDHNDQYLAELYL